MNFFKTTLNVALTILLITLSTTSSFSQTTTVSPEYKLEKIGFSRVTYAGSDKRFSYFIYRFSGDEGENPFEFKNTTRINPYNGSINRGYQYTINAPAIDDNTCEWSCKKNNNH